MPSLAAASRRSFAITVLVSCVVRSGHAIRPRMLRAMMRVAPSISPRRLYCARTQPCRNLAVGRRPPAARVVLCSVCVIDRHRISFVFAIDSSRFYHATGRVHLDTHLCAILCRLNHCHGLHNAGAAGWRRVGGGDGGAPSCARCAPFICVVAFARRLSPLHRARRCFG